MRKGVGGDEPPLDRRTGATDTLWTGSRGDGVCPGRAREEVPWRGVLTGGVERSMRVGATFSLWVLGEGVESQYTPLTRRDEGPMYSGEDTRCSCCRAICETSRSGNHHGGDPPACACAAAPPKA